MGNLQAMGYAEMVSDGSVRLTQALSAHLGSNFYPPLPQAYVAPLERAINRVNAGENPWNSEIILPHDIDPRPRRSRVTDKQVRVTTGDLIDSCRAWFFLDSDDDLD